MADLYKTTWFIKYGDGGFSFSHLIEQDGYDEVKARAETLAHAYLKCCGRAVYLPQIRISRENILGDSVIYPKRFRTIAANDVGEGDHIQVKVAEGDTPDFQNTAILLRLGCNASIRGFQHMRGVPDNLIIMPDGKANFPEWDKAIAKYFNFLDVDGWGLKAVPKGPDSRKKIKTVAKQPGTTVMMTTVAAHGFQADNKIHISGVLPKTSLLNGDHTVDATGNLTEFSLRYSENFDIAGVDITKAVVWSKEKVFTRFAAIHCHVVRVSSRRAGRPFGQLVGRRKKKA